MTLRNEGAGRPLAAQHAPRTLRLASDWIAVRELPEPTPADQLIIQVDTGPQRGTLMRGIVEHVGPGQRTKRGTVLPCEVMVGQIVWFPVEAGRARLPWDYPVRVMRESELSGVVEPTIAPHPDDLSNAERERLTVAAHNRLLPVRER